MPPKKKCSCKRHVEYSDDDSAIVKIEPKKIKKAIINALMNRGDISGHSKYICNGCLRQGEAYVVENVNETAEDTTPQVNEIIKLNKG